MLKQIEAVAIAGIGQTEFSKHSGRSELSLAAESVKNALDDAGLTVADVDGLVTYTIDSNEEVDLVRTMGMGDISFFSRVPFGGAGAVGTIAHACAAIRAGVANVVVVWRAMNERSENRFGQIDTTRGRTVGGGGTSDMSWAFDMGAYTPMAWQALNAKVYMDRFGVTNEDFGRVVVEQRRYAATNPNAHFYQRPVTLEEHQDSPWIVEPVLRKFDCCQESDGGVAVVLTSLERARDLRQPPVAVVAAQGGGNGSQIATNHYAEDLSVMSEAFVTARHLFAMADITPVDIQVAQLYDAYSCSVLYQLEAFGFCGVGEAADFVRDGHLAIDGRLPTNTHGGLIGEAYIHGLNSLTEGVRQARGKAVNQVFNVQNVLVASGWSAAILSRDQ
ncbi:lipid-transfer protein [Seongchinamella unica]|uniref:Lipid-transfer protein n=1 Tax=Seongchinamella unica TaxID=2547392 RepID=A0A4R5LMQ1_9GAMM|nr:lipid-transfer protein [Seongchinamella unica]TDG11313.1 lipid-transfer protein [Seongchinamella unica]